MSLRMASFSRLNARMTDPYTRLLTAKKPLTSHQRLFDCRFSVSMLVFTEHALDGNLGHSLCGRFRGTHDRPFDKGASFCNRISGRLESPAILCGTPREMRF